MCKALNAEMIPKEWNGMEMVINEENTKRNPHVLDPIVVTVCDDQNEEITYLRKVEHIRIHKAIQRGNLRICKLEKDWV